MKRALIALLLLASAAFTQTRSRLVDYAIILQDEPVAQRYHPRVALKSTGARKYENSIQLAQASLLQELQRRKVTVTGSSRTLVNAIYIRTTADAAASLLHLPGVAHIVRVPPLRLELDKALSLENVAAAWTAVGGPSNAGTGIKIAIIDSGIDQNHPGFQDPTLTPPAGYPKGDTAYTNKKIIVARSYVAYNSKPDVTQSTPDDTTPRDRVGHGTAIAMIAAGVQNTGPQATIQGLAPKAFLGNYKVYGSPGINDFASYLGVQQALQDAVADGMDVATLSLGEGDMPTAGPLDFDTSCSDDGSLGACDIYAQAVQNAVTEGLIVIVAAGNDGSIGFRSHSLSTIHTPGTAPAAITVGATSNSHVLYQAVHISGPGAPASLQSIPALYGDGPHLPLPSLPVIDIARLGDNGQACSQLPAGSLTGSIALVQRGTCFFSDKINNAQNAGALGVIIYQQTGLENIYSSLGAPNTGIPAMMIGYTNGVALKNFLSNGSGANASFDMSFTPSNTIASVMWPNSSRGPSLGSFAPTNQPHRAQTYDVKPELVAVGAGIYTATQKLDPNGDLFNATGYAGVSGTSFAVPMVAGAAALVKQMHPTWTPVQVKSALVNTATQDVVDTDGTVASVNAAGAGKLSVGDAVAATAAVDPATVSFGPILTTTLAGTPIRRLTLFNLSTSPATFTFAVQPRQNASAIVTVAPTSLALQPGGQNSVSLTLTGSVPAAGSYEGFIVISGPAGTPTLRVPYLFQSLAAVPADVFQVRGGAFIGAVEDKGWLIALRMVDQSGVPIFGPVTFRIVEGGASFPKSDDPTDPNPEVNNQYFYGIAGAVVDLGSDQGPQTFTGTAGGFTVEFDGYARRVPAIASNGVKDAGSYRNDRGLAPGSYIAIYGTDLADNLQVYSTPYLPVSLSTVSVNFDGGGLSLPGHLHFVSPGQINVQIPWEFQGQSSVQMKVSLMGREADLQSALYTVPLANYAPAFFLNSGTVADAVDNTTGAIITASNPATAGEILQLYANGLGPVTSQPPSGEPAAASPLSQTTGPVTVTIGGKQATVLNNNIGFLAPGFVGLYQVNIQVPPGLTPGNQPIVISAGGVSSAATVGGSTVMLPVK